MMFASKLAVFAGLASTALAHGTVWGYTADGVYHENNHPNPEAGEVPEAAGWFSENVDRGFVSVKDYADPDIICHRDARPSKHSATVAAGGTVDFHWTPWDASHMGPAMTYVANCNGDCGDVDKEALEWVKIDEAAWDKDAKKWANVMMMENNNTWTTTVPETLAPGKYVFRHEIIAIYGKQHYPSCINIEITGDGTDKPEGVIGTELYHEGDSTGSEEDYNIPGPKMYTPISSPEASGSSRAVSASSTAQPSSSTAEVASSSAESASSMADAASPTITDGSNEGTTPSATSESSVEASATPTSDVVSQSVSPSSSPCSSAAARRHARDIQM